MVDYVKEQLSEKWGKWGTTDMYEFIGNPEYLNKDLHFSYIFTTEELEQIVRYADECKIVLTEEINKFYSTCNGMRLFLSSFSIFGIQAGTKDMEPYDIKTENYNIHARMMENCCDVPKWFFIGSYGDYVFAYDAEDSQCIKCVENGYSNVLMTFETIKDLLHYFVPRMMDKYKDNLYKKKPNKEFKKVPSLANAMFELDELK